LNKCLLIQRILFVLIVLVLSSCNKVETDPAKKAKKIKFDKWNEAIIPRDSRLIASNQIAKIKKALYRTNIEIEVLKKAYILNGYEEIPNPDSKNIKIKKSNVDIEFIIVDDNNINIMIDIGK